MTIGCVVSRVLLAALRLVFRFDPWHAGASYACRPYKKMVVALADSVNPRSVVEVGCGLGDIVSRVNASRRIGMDADDSVLRAARLLHPGVRWIHGDARSLGDALGAEDAIDCMIMVNWIHTLSAEDLAALLCPILPRLRYLIVDAIDADGPVSYRFRHDFAFLAPLVERVSQLRPPGEPRSLVLFRIRA